MRLFNCSTCLLSVKAVNPLYLFYSGINILSSAKCSINFMGLFSIPNGVLYVFLQEFIDNQQYVTTLYRMAIIKIGLIVSE
jgi:hypothetical protein